MRLSRLKLAGMLLALAVVLPAGLCHGQTSNVSTSVPAAATTQNQPSTDTAAGASSAVAATAQSRPATLPAADDSAAEEADALAPVQPATDGKACANASSRVINYKSWIKRYSYPAVFLLLVLGIVGLPLPDEIMMTYVGSLVHKGDMLYTLTVVAAFAGSMCGISLSYLIGRTLGHRFVVRFGRYIHVDENRLQRVHAWYDRIGKWALTFGYFIPGVRHVTALVAGTSGVASKEFAVFAYSGAFLWVNAFVGLGFALSHFVSEKGKLVSESQLEQLIVTVGVITTVAFVSIAAIAHLIKRCRKRSAAKAAKAAAPAVASSNKDTVTKS